MMNRTTSFVVGALTCVIAGASFVTMHLADAGAADECLAAPNKASSPSQHWYYRIDRATQRHCWYLGDAGKAVSRAAKAASAHRSTLTDTDREAELARSAANVHAELPMPQMSRDDDAKVTSNTPAAPVAPAAPESGKAAQGASSDSSGDASRSSDVWRALDAANFKLATSEAPQPSPSVASPPAADATPDYKQEPAASSAPVTAPAASSAPVTAPAASSAPVTAPAVAQPSASSAPPVPLTRPDVSAMSRATSLSALFLAAFGALVFVTLATTLAYFFTDRTRSRKVDGGGLSLPQDWPPEPFRLPSSLRLLAHGSFVDESAPAPSRAYHVDDAYSGTQPNQPRDSEVHQIEQLLTRVVRRSENLRGRIASAASPGSA